MSNYSITQIFDKLLEDKKFRDNYLLAYLDRFVYSTTDLEKQLTPEKRKKAIENLLEAFNYLMEKGDQKLSPNDISIIGNFINEDSGIQGFRKINVTAGKYADWTPVEPRRIYYCLYSLLDNYYNIWQERDVYEKEAAFHVMLMRIHPLEDGNKRMAKIILNANLVKQNYPPVIITEEETKIYYEFINKQDIEGFATFLKSKSMQELNNIISNYKVAYNIPITESVYEAVNLENNEGGRK